MAVQSSVLAWRIPMNRGAWRATVHRVTKSQTRLSDYVQPSTDLTQVRRLSVVISLVSLQILCVCVFLSGVRLFATPWTVAYQASLFMGFSWLPFPSPGDLPDSGIEPGSPTWQAGSLPSEPPGSPWILSLSLLSIVPGRPKKLAQVLPTRGGS